LRENYKFKSCTTRAKNNKNMKTLLRIDYNGNEHFIVADQVVSLSETLKTYVDDNKLAIEQVRISKDVDGVFSLFAEIYAFGEKNAVLGSCSFSCQISNDTEAIACQDLKEFFRALSLRDIH